jgi:hypothetical protein
MSFSRLKYRLHCSPIISFSTCYHRLTRDRPLVRVTGGRETQLVLRSRSSYFWYSVINFPEV